MKLNCRGIPFYEIEVLAITQKLVKNLQPWHKFRI